MSDSLLAWFERELSFLRSGGRKFAEEHPQLARHMGMSYDSISDPHVARVIESFALLNARLSRQLSEDSTRISNNLLQILFPLVLQSLPSVSMLQIKPAKDQSSVTTLPSGTRFRVYIDDDRFCGFHTTRELQLCPFDVADSAILQRPFNLDTHRVPEQASAVVKIDLAMLDESVLFSQLPDFAGLTVHFHGLARHLAQFYDCLFRNRFSVVLTNEHGTQVSIPDACFRPVGMTSGDCMITHENTTFIDHQMMMEVLSWPELFYGFRLLDIGDYLRQFSDSRLSLLIVIGDAPQSLAVAPDDIRFLLGCAPVINLFDQIAEPMVIDHRQLDYPLIPDSHSPNKLEIQAVKQVMDITGEQPEVLPPFCGLKHNDIGCDKFWIYNSPDRESGENGRLALICPDLNPDQNETMVLSPHLICSNGNQVLDISDNPRLECLDSIAICGKPKMIMRPTAHIRRSPGVKNRLNLLVHLRAGFSSILQEKNPAESLRNLMQLYCFNNNACSRAWLDAMTVIKTRPLVAPIRIGSYQCFTQGMEIILELDPEKLRQSGLMMFVNLIDYMVAGFAGYQSFLQLIVRLKGQPGDYVRCTRRHGYQINR